MTGPVLRGDVTTVKKHLDVLEGEEREIHRLLGKRLLQMALRKQEAEAAGQKRETDLAVSEQLRRNYLEINGLLS